MGGALEGDITPRAWLNAMNARVYDQRVRQIEHGLFSLQLVLSTGDGMRRTASIVYKRIASM